MTGFAGNPQRPIIVEVGEPADGKCGLIYRRFYTRTFGFY